MEEEIAELKSRDAELEQLSNTEDHIHFLKTFQSAIDPPQFKDLSNITINQGLSFEAVKKSVSKLKTQLEDFCRKEVMMISAAVSEVQAVCPEPVTRQESFSGMGSAFTLPGFGQQASGTSLFGQPSVTSLFGQPSVTSLFGQANGASTMGTASGTSLFGQASGASTLGTGFLYQAPSSGGQLGSGSAGSGFGFGANTGVQSGQPNQAGLSWLFGNTNQNPPRSGH
ncbi:nucleoporin NUP116/NSP116-like isoform X2 [Clupea harengus]|uniref:Nucleoporin NUP116/NSP116-like isoform X2 n=1 Tax=Clupea harengus TaxID=7950 RepID=A0A6P8FTX6_CLUHA|nr:nucleoporin NUP116/NSP116-like isoform X2 [Clupea harengus]